MQAYFNKPHIKFYGIFLWVIFSGFGTNYSAFAQEEIKKRLQEKIKKHKENNNFQRDTTYINLLYALGMQYAQYNLDSLLIISNESIKLSKAMYYPKGEAQGYLIEGLYYSNTGKQDLAISYFQKSVSIASASSEINLLLESKIKLAAEYKYKEDYANALKYYLEAIEIAKAYDSDKYLSKCYLNISSIYRVQKEYEQTILFLSKSLKINQSNNDDVQFAKNLNNLTACYIEMGNLDKATVAVDNAISIFEKVKLDSWLSYAYELKGSIHTNKGQFYQALEWLNKSEKIHDKIDKGRYKIPLALNLSKTYFGLKDYDKAEAYALKALEISEKLNVLEERDVTLELLYKIEKINGTPEKALAYLEDLKAISDTINKNNNIKELRILKSNLEFEQKKEQYISESQQKHVLQRSYIYFSILIILAFAIIIFILKKNNKTQNALNQKLLENTEALKKNEIHLNEANNTKSRLFSIIAHDLKGPIDSFKSLLDLFNKSELSKTEFMHFMPQIGENIDSIAFTLNNLLTWGQSQMDGLSTKPDVIPLKTLVDESLRLLSKQAEVKSISTINNIDKNVIAWSDRDQIDVVIRNLISNALKFTREHGIITISAVEKALFWEVQIQDNGVGMSEDALSKIFTENETASSYGTRNEKGTGLGLRVCKEMVENNGGTIWVESNLNYGSSFYFTVSKSKTL
ncbi:ATP-binding protein [Algibacter miyuki]|uniref:histidine kinase n=1 Tax=Algibacter miyuki TaxID=1306933 RepID=A0ABV5GZL8_9FLAO|nr:ATP-binding protein [Algibacter miyuki]MDN3667291.1 ATP-binding protein [Algibacter miyuki]